MTIFSIDRLRTVANLAHSRFTFPAHHSVVCREFPVFFDDGNRATLGATSHEQSRYSRTRQRHTVRLGRVVTVDDASGASRRRSR